MSGIMGKMNGWTPSIILAIIVTVGAFVIMYTAPDSNAVNVVVGWVSIIIAGFFGNALVEHEKAKTDNSDNNGNGNNNK